MKMIFKRAAFMSRLIQRIDIALCHYIDHEDEGIGAGVVFDAVAISGFELMQLDPGYWHPLEEEVAVLIDEIKTACLEYEFSDLLKDKAADRKFIIAAKDSLKKMIPICRSFNDNADPPWLIRAPIAELLHDCEPHLKKEEHNKTNAERAARSRKLKKHILVLQVRTDNALSDLCDALTDLLGGGGQ